MSDIKDGDYDWSFIILSFLILLVGTMFSWVVWGLIFVWYWDWFAVTFFAMESITLAQGIAARILLGLPLYGLQLQLSEVKSEIDLSQKNKSLETIMTEFCVKTLFYPALWSGIGYLSYWVLITFF